MIVRLPIGFHVDTINTNSVHQRKVTMAYKDSTFEPYTYRHKCGNTLVWKPQPVVVCPKHITVIRLLNIEPGEYIQRSCNNNVVILNRLTRRYIREQRAVKHPMVIVTTAVEKGIHILTEIRVSRDSNQSRLTWTKED